MNFDLFCLLFGALLFFILDLTIAKIENSTNTGIVKMTYLSKKCEGFDCVSPKLINCPKSKTNCYQKCSSHYCYLLCDKMNIKCKQKCESNVCKQSCVTKECKMNCIDTRKCIQIAGDVNKYGTHHLNCKTDSLQGCIQECSGNCSLKCQSDGLCKQIIRTPPPCEGLIYGKAECSSDKLCVQHCVGLFCIFTCDSPVCQISTTDFAVVGLLLSKRVERVILHCDYEKISFSNWSYTVGYRLCHCMDKSRVALSHEILPECVVDSANQVLSPIQNSGEKKSGLVLKDEEEELNETALDTYSLLKGLKQELTEIKEMKNLKKNIYISTSTRLRASILKNKYLLWPIFFLAIIFII